MSTETTSLVTQILVLLTSNFVFNISFDCSDLHFNPLSDNVPVNDLNEIIKISN